MIFKFAEFRLQGLAKYLRIMDYGFIIKMSMQATGKLPFNHQNY